MRGCVHTHAQAHTGEDAIWTRLYVVWIDARERGESERERERERERESCMHVCMHTHLYTIVHTHSHTGEGAIRARLHMVWIYRPNEIVGAVAHYADSTDAPRPAAAAAAAAAAIFTGFAVRGWTVRVDSLIDSSYFFFMFWGTQKDALNLCTVVLLLQREDRWEWERGGREQKWKGSWVRGWLGREGVGGVDTLLESTVISRS